MLTFDIYYTPSEETRKKWSKKDPQIHVIANVSVDGLNPRRNSMLTFDIQYASTKETDKTCSKKIPRRMLTVSNRFPANTEAPRSVAEPTVHEVGVTSLAKSAGHQRFIHLIRRTVENEACSLSQKISD